MKGDFGSSVSPTPATQKLLLVRAKLGAEESGHPRAHNQPSKQRRTRVSGSGGGTISKVVNGDSELLKQCQERSELSGEQ